MRKLVMVMFAVVVALSFVQVVKAETPYTGMKMAGEFGFGYFNSGTPLGFKYWLGDRFAIDAGVGFATGAGQNFGIQAGIDIVLASFDSVLLQFRPAIGFDIGAVTNLSWPIMAEVEYFVTKNMSLNLGVGILLYLPGGGSFTVTHAVGSTGNLGFYFYF